MSSGATYVRTSGSEVLGLTWQAVQARGDIDPITLLSPEQRTSYDAGSRQARLAFRDAVLRRMTQPPAFLRFDLANGPDLIAAYPGACSAGDSRTKAQDGKVVNFDRTVQRIRDAISIQRGVAAAMAFDAKRLRDELVKFSGMVSVDTLEAGQRLFRTVGLTAKSAEHYGSITNRLLGDYWELTPPGQFECIDEWRANTAVLWEWNGDHGHLMVTLKRPVLALVGMVSHQPLGRGDWVLPGGGMQVFVPAISDDDLLNPISARPLSEVILETRFGSGAIA